MRRLVDLGKSSPQLALAAVVALLVLGAAAMSYRDAEADLLSFELSGNVVLDGGSVIATITGDNDPPDSDNVFIYSTSSAVSNVGQGAEDTALFPAGITPLTCVILGAGGEPCDNEIVIDVQFEPQVCTNILRADLSLAAAPGGEACVEYGSDDMDDDTDPETFEATLEITIDCPNGNLAVPITAGEQNGGDDTVGDQETIWVYCLTTPNFTLEKVFEGEPADQAFQFTYNGPGCLLSIETPPAVAPAPTPIADGDPFSLMNGQIANFFCGPGTHTVSEVDAIVESQDCVGTGPDGFSFDGSTLGTIEVTFPENDASGVLDCPMVNSGVDAGSTVNVQKVCVDAEELDGTFSVALDDGEAVEIACGDTVPFEDVEAGTHTLTETIEGADAEDFETVIICGDGEVQEGTEATLEVVAGEDQLCLVINGADLTDLICDECPCGCGTEIDIDLDNNNNNTIGIDNSNTNNNANDNDNANFNDNENKNENNNENKNEQNQENTQDQNNSNTQTNNITSSPEVNIDFD